MQVVLTAEQIARVCHEANRAYCMNVGDHSHPTWDQAPEWQRRSTVSGVEGALGNPDRTPRQSHEEWMAVKLTEGWKHGPKKAPDLREHPCLVPYDELLDVDRAKDELFLAVVNVLRPLTLAAQQQADAIPEPPALEPEREDKKPKRRRSKKA